MTRDLQGWTVERGRLLVDCCVNAIVLRQMYKMIAVRQVEESSEVPSPTTPERRPHADAPEAPAALSKAAAEALERYKRSAAAAATAAEQHAASGTGNAQMQAGTANDQLPLPKVSSRPCTSTYGLLSDVRNISRPWALQVGAAAAAAKQGVVGRRKYGIK